MFPGAGARVYRNEAGEPLGWDYPSYDEPEYDDFAADDIGHDPRDVIECVEWGMHGDNCDTNNDGTRWVCMACGDDAGPVDTDDAPILGQVVESIDPNPDII